jgi:multidrug resistance efflux pump
MRAVLIVAIVLGAVAGIGGRLALKSQAEAVDRPEHKAATSWTAQVFTNGQIEGARPEVAFRPEIAGTIKAVHVRENQEVTQGTLLVELANETQKAHVALAESDLAEAKAQLERLRNGERKEKRAAQAAIVESKHVMYEQAEADFKRSQDAKQLSRNSVSGERLDQDRSKMLQAKADWKTAKAELDLIEAPAREDEVKAAEARIDAAKARLQLAQAELAKTRLLAPFNCRIVQIYAEPGEMAGPTTTQPILILADLSRWRVRAFVEELDVAHVKVGQEATVTAEPYPGKEFPGKLAVVVPRMGKRSLQSDAPGEYKDLYFREVLIDLNTNEELPLNLRVQARIHVNPREDKR